MERGIECMPAARGSQYWRARAAEARNMATEMGDKDAEGTMLVIASMYELMAERAEVAERKIPR